MRQQGRQQALGQVCAIDPNSIISGEEASIVFQDDEVVVADLAVGGVDVGNVYVAVLQATVGEVVIECPHLAVGNPQPVSLLERPPAVVAFLELLGEPKAQVVMVTKVREGPDAASPSDIGP